MTIDFISFKFYDLIMRPVRPNDMNIHDILYDIKDIPAGDATALDTHEKRHSSIKKTVKWAGGLVLTGILVFGAHNKVEGDKVENRYPTADEVCVIDKAIIENPPLLKVADKYWDGGDEIRGGAARMGETSRSNPDNLYGVCFDRQEQHNRVVPADHIPPEQVVKPESFPGYTN